eukprot:TRINITY_DN1476_c0_g2_i1.p1 TRINITY_DN1476_c0_g2~~TRINITY_DN1476_c0_g2_i1.p1  ORF type:complete len:533 (+),score=88.92 TRINITY_DN1476_c0_g2_i1:300-1898(+)
MMKWQIVIVLFLLGAVCGQRYEFKHSFKSPFYLGKGGTMPFWEFGGGAIISDDYVRLTPVYQGRFGWLWNTVDMEMDSWEVQLDFLIDGGGRKGADGMAFWCTEERKMNGPVYGNMNKWTGVAVIFDSFDNDEKGDNPRISIIDNDGTKIYKGDGNNIEACGCSVDFRTKRSKAKIVYQDGVLTVTIDTGNGAQRCCSKPLTLPSTYYLGLSAATGEAVDNHDVFSLVTNNLDPFDKKDNNGEREASNKPNESLKQRLSLMKNRINNKNGEGTDDTVQDTKRSPTTEEKRRSEAIEREILENQVKNRLGKREPPLEANSETSLEALHKLEVQVEDVRRQQQSMNAVVTSLRKSIGSDVTNAVDGLNARMELTIQSQMNDRSDDTLIKQIQDTMHTQTVALTKAIETFQVELSTLREEIGTIKQDIAAKVHEMHNSFAEISKENAPKTDNLERKLDEMKTKMNRVQAITEISQTRADELVTGLKQDNERLVDKIEESSSFGFWTYFLFFQACFFVAFVIWKKLRDDAGQKFKV